MQHDDEEDVVYYADRLNKTAAKREIKQIEVLARELSEIPDAQFAGLPAEGDLREEIALARSTKGHGSRKRQIKHLTAVLRRDDEAREAIQAYIEGNSAAQRLEAVAFHRLEELRDRLCTFETMADALSEVRTSWPLINLREIEKMAKRAWAGKDRTAYRKVFRLLKQAEEQHRSADD